MFHGQHEGTARGDSRGRGQAGSGEGIKGILGHWCAAVSRLQEASSKSESLIFGRSRLPFPPNKYVALRLSIPRSHYAAGSSSQHHIQSDLLLLFTRRAVHYFPT